jgi:hypothetical protein
VEEKMVGIPFRVRKIEANSGKSVPNHSAKEKTTWNSVPWKKIDENSQNSMPKHVERFGQISLLSYLAVS